MTFSLARTIVPEGMILFSKYVVYFFNCMLKNFVPELTLDASTTRAKMKLKKLNASS